MKCVEVYKELYHQEPFDVAFCPYRISPLGAHIDHQYGKINGLAIDKGIHMAYHPKQNGVVELQSLNFPKRAQFFVSAVPEEKQGDWADHLRGAAKMLGEKYRLSGFLRCADCGQNMIRRTVTKNGKKYQYYHCSTYKNGGGCTPHMINSEKLTESVLAAIRHQVTLLVEAEKVLSNAELASSEQIGIKILDSQITALEAELERYSNLKIRLYQDLCDDVVSREEYGEMNTRFAQKIKEAQDKIHEIREKKQEALKHDTLLPTWLEEFKQYEHIKTLERRVVVELIDHIDVHSKTEIEIHFCFEDELHSITEKFMEYQAHHGNEVAEE